MLFSHFLFFKPFKLSWGHFLGEIGFKGGSPNFFKFYLISHFSNKFYLFYILRNFEVNFAFLELINLRLFYVLISHWLRRFFNIFKSLMPLYLIICAIILLSSPKRKETFETLMLFLFSICEFQAIRSRNFCIEILNVFYKFLFMMLFLLFDEIFSKYVIFQNISPIWQILYQRFRWFFIWKIIGIWTVAFWLWFVIETRWRFSESCLCSHRNAGGLLDKFLPPFFVLLIFIIWPLLILLITLQIMREFFQNIDLLSIFNGSNRAVAAVIFVLF